MRHCNVFFPPRICWQGLPALLYLKRGSRRSAQSAAPPAAPSKMHPAEASPSRTSLAERYRVLLEIGRTLTGTLSPGDLYRTIYRETVKVLEASGFYISLYDQARDVATVVFFADQGRERRAEITYRGSDSEVIRSGEGSLVRDSLQGNSLLVLGEEDSEVTRAAISAPLRYKGRVIGAISAQSYAAGTYGEADLELLQGIADVAAVAVENARHVAELEQRRMEAEQIEEIGRALTSSLDHEDVLAKVIHAVLELLRADGATVWLREESGIARVGASGGDMAIPTGDDMTLSQDLIDALVEGRRPILLDDISESPLLPRAVRKDATSTSAVIVPLLIADEVAGALSASVYGTRGFTDEDIHLLQRLANQAAVALENAQLHGEVQALTLTDPLTRLPNRRHMAVHLEKEFAAARRGRPLAVVLFDVDDFKGFNDTRGHVAGDEALRRIGAILSAESRAMNLAARYGGDEFLSVLAEATPEGCEHHIHRVRSRVARDGFLGQASITLSYGLAEYDPSMESPEDLIRAADRDLYRFKAGRRAGA